VLAHSDRAIVLHKGRVALQGGAEAVAASGELTRLLGV
jgi:ABC-type branched-subunit amino acid transport system ATPase component